jgi:hypothetical protein
VWDLPGVFDERTDSLQGALREHVSGSRPNDEENVVVTGVDVLNMLVGQEIRIVGAEVGAVVGRQTEIPHASAGSDRHNQCAHENPPTPANDPSGVSGGGPLFSRLLGHD